MHRACSGSLRLAMTISAVLTRPLASYSFFTMPGLSVPLMEIASAPDGTIWATSFTPGLLLRLNPRTGSFTSYYAPFTGTNKGGLYGLLVTPDNEVWVTISAENAVARLDVPTHRFIYY